MHPDCEVFGLDYQTFTPWETGAEICQAVEKLKLEYESIHDFTKNHNAMLTVMEGGEHWFHTDEQLQFLDDWIRRKEKEWT